MGSKGNIKLDIGGNQLSVSNIKRIRQAHSNVSDSEFEELKQESQLPVKSLKCRGYRRVNNKVTHSPL